VADELSRRELAHFLRSRRERVRPDAVGLPIGPRRRTRGLRREEVAVLAGLSPTWYTYLEQGRDIRPSPEVLESLARVLGLSEDERMYVRNLVQRRGVKPDPAVDQVAVALVREIVAVAEASEWPVYAFDHLGSVLSWNRAAGEWYTDWGALSAEDRNIVWWMVTAAEARERIADWECDARDIVARFRAASARYPADGRMLDLVSRLNQASPEFARWWADHDIRGQRMRVRRFRRGAQVRAMRLVVAHPSDYNEVSLAYHLPPGDDAGA
jgi:transcriptional regulator with XRE-family HTH domain